MIVKKNITLVLVELVFDRAKHLIKETVLPDRLTDDAPDTQHHFDAYGNEYFYQWRVC